jgi:hypothetical protein
MPLEYGWVDTYQAVQGDIDSHAVVGAGRVELVLEGEAKVAILPNRGKGLCVGFGCGRVDEVIQAEVEEMRLVLLHVTPPPIEVAHRCDVVGDPCREELNDRVIFD